MALLKLESGDVVCIGGCIIPSEAPIIRPFVHIATLVELIRYVYSFLATNVQTNIKKWLMVVVESNLATMGSIYFQYIRLMFSNLQDVLVNSKLVFPGDIQSSPAASPISQRIGIYVNSRTEYKAWIVYVGALCECMLHDGGIRRITALTREVCCQLMSRGQFRLNTYFYDGISLLRLADAKRSETVEVDIGRQQAVRIPDLSKDKAKDDLYMRQAVVFLFALGCRRWCGWTRWLAVYGGGGGLGWGWLQWLLAAGGGSPGVACCSLEGWWLRAWVWVPPSHGVGVGGGVGSRHSWPGALWAGLRCWAVFRHSWRGACVLCPVFPGRGMASVLLDGCVGGLCPWFGGWPVARGPFVVLGRCVVVFLQVACVGCVRRGAVWLVVGL